MVHRFCGKTLCTTTQVLVIFFSQCWCTLLPSPQCVPYTEYDKINGHSINHRQASTSFPQYYPLYISNSISPALVLHFSTTPIVLLAAEVRWSWTNSSSFMRCDERASGRIGSKKIKFGLQPGMSCEVKPNENWPRADEIWFGIELIMASLTGYSIFDFWTERNCWKSSLWTYSCCRCIKFRCWRRSSLLVELNEHATWQIHKYAPEIGKIYKADAAH